jgi:hypothetical protein
LDMVIDWTKEFELSLHITFRLFHLTSPIKMRLRFEFS